MMENLKKLHSQDLWPYLSQGDQEWFRHLSERYPFTFQELRQLLQSSRDLGMGEEKPFQSWWGELEAGLDPGKQGIERKRILFQRLVEKMQSFKSLPKEYPEAGLAKPVRTPLKVTVEASEKKIFGNCPVASEKTVCCNLKTIDAVENCAFGCSYCTIETFYGENVVFDRDFHRKLEAIELDPNRFYHIGTGQSSDSLVWGNREGILDALCDFARKHPNILLEFKTKSANITYFREKAGTLPRNIVCSWSLNTETIVSNEEHFTAPLARRLEAARTVADLGVRVAFHFHPMVYYAGWQEGYLRLARDVQNLFKTEEVLFLSFGSVTFIKPVMRAIRERGEPTKILQMEMVQDPHGKWTYPDAIKCQMFQAMYEAFRPWRGNVFMYLCMERAYFWDEVFGWHYPTNEAFERDFGDQTMRKLSPIRQL